MTKKPYTDIYGDVHDSPNPSDWTAAERLTFTQKRKTATERLESQQFRAEVPKMRFQQEKGGPVIVASSRENIPEALAEVGKRRTPLEQLPEVGTLAEERQKRLGLAKTSAQMFESGELGVIPERGRTTGQRTFPKGSFPETEAKIEGLRELQLKRRWRKLGESEYGDPHHYVYDPNEMITLSDGTRVRIGETSAETAQRVKDEIGLSQARAQYAGGVRGEAASAVMDYKYGTIEENKRARANAILKTAGLPEMPYGMTHEQVPAEPEVSDVVISPEDAARREAISAHGLAKIQQREGVPSTAFPAPSGAPTVPAPPSAQKDALFTREQKRQIGTTSIPAQKRTVKRVFLGLNRQDWSQLDKADWARVVELQKEVAQGLAPFKAMAKFDELLKSRGAVYRTQTEASQGALAIEALIGSGDIEGAATALGNMSPQALDALLGLSAKTGKPAGRAEQAAAIMRTNKVTAEQALSGLMTKERQALEKEQKGAAQEQRKEVRTQRVNVANRNVSEALVEVKEDKVLLSRLVKRRIELENKDFAPDDPLYKTNEERLTAVKDEIIEITGGVNSEKIQIKGTLPEAESRLKTAKESRDNIDIDQTIPPQIRRMGGVISESRTPEGGEPIPEPPPGYYGRANRMLTQPTTQPAPPMTTAQPTTQPTTQPVAETPITRPDQLIVGQRYTNKKGRTGIWNGQTFDMVD